MREPKEAFETITFEAADGLRVTADLYAPHPAAAPFIVLFHKARASRGEYREIAPELNALGFNAMAVDQRSGDAFADVINETAKGARAAGKRTAYIDTLQDMEAAIDYAKARYAKGRFLIWGSSYSAALSLKIAGDGLAAVDAVLAFSPGEYFEDQGKGSNFIGAAARKINVPVFITSGRGEKDVWAGLAGAIPAGKAETYLPSDDGIHGSSTLNAESSAREETWNAVRAFLRRFGGK